MPSEVRKEECGLHAHFDAQPQAATSSGATWGSAKPTTHLRGHKPVPRHRKKGYAVDVRSYLSLRARACTKVNDYSYVKARRMHGACRA